MKKLVLVMLSVLAAGVMLASCAKKDEKAASGEKPVTLNFSHTMAPNSMSDMAAKKFKELVEAKSNGSIKINIVTNSGLSGGDLSKAIEMVGTGDIDIHAAAPTNIATFDPRFYIFWMPFLFPTTDSLMNVLHDQEIMNMVGEWTEKQNIRLLGIHNAGARQLSNNKKEIRTPEDLKGMNIRVPGAKLFIDCFRDSFGANPTAMDFSEVYTALQQHTIDGQENPVSVFDSSKFNEVQKYLTLWNYVRDTTGWYMSEKSYQKLSPAQQEAVTSCATEALNWTNDYLSTNETNILAKLKASGVQVADLSEDEIAAFSAKCQPLYESYKSVIGADVIAKFQAAAGK